MEEILDEFEVHTQFLDMLKQNLSARSIQKLAEFVYKYKDFNEPLFEDIMSTLQECNPTKRLNLFYLMDSILKQSKKYRFDGYSIAILARLEQIIEAVLDMQRQNGKVTKKPDKYGLTYLTSIKKVLTVWKANNWIPENQYSYHITMLDQLQKLNPQPLSKEAIFRRMEEDRDRQKRQREESWIPDRNEFEGVWTKCQELNHLDFALFKELKEKYDLSKRKK
jgi:CTD kinase subunit gamma